MSDPVAIRPFRVEVPQVETDELRRRLQATAFHATRADLLRRVGRSAESRVAYDRAIELADNAAEIALLTRRRDKLSGE